MIQALHENINIYLAGAGGGTCQWEWDDGLYWVWCCNVFSKWMESEHPPHKPSEDWEYFDTAEIVNSDWWYIIAPGSPGKIKMKIIKLYNKWYLKRSFVAAPSISSSIELGHVFVSIVGFNDRHFGRESFSDKKLFSMQQQLSVIKTLNTNVRARPRPETKLVRALGRCQKCQ